MLLPPSWTVLRSRMPRSTERTPPRTEAVDQMPSATHPGRSEGWRWAGWLAAGCAFVTVPRLLLHELWRDEASLWLLVTESRSLPELVTALGRDGHGYLFGFLCYLASQVSHSPRAMQLVNLLMVGAGALTLARWAPFPRRTRALLALGYLPFYEYAVISRHYATGVLLAWLACAAARSRRPAIGVGLAIGLVCQTTVYGYLVGVGIAVAFLVDRWRRGAELPSISTREALAGAALALGGAVAGVVELIPEPGTSFAAGWRLHWDAPGAMAALSIPWRGFVPLPRVGLHFWNTNVLDAWPAWQVVAGLATLAFATAILLPCRAALAGFAVGGLGLLVFGYTKYLGTLRHHGHWWILFVAALWLAGGVEPAVGGRSWRSAALTLLLVLHGAVMVYASWMDLRHPFSNGARAAEQLRKRGLDRYPLVGYREPPAAPVALALGRPLYAASRQAFTTHADWGPLQRDVTPEELRCAARGLARRLDRDVVLVLNEQALVILPMTNGRPRAWPELRAVGSAVGAIERSEDYYLYRLDRQSLGFTARNAACPGEAVDPR